MITNFVLSLDITVPDKWAYSSMPRELLVINQAITINRKKFSAHIFRFRANCSEEANSPSGHWKIIIVHVTIPNGIR